MDLDLAQLDQDAEAYVKDLDIPPCPAIITRIVREARTEEPDLNRIAALISTDVALSAAMLSTVNSAYYGLRQRAETIHRALVFLGAKTCAQLATRLMLPHAFPISNNLAMERFWATAARASLLARMVARHAGNTDPELACTFAMFRDAGMPLLLARFPQYEQLMSPEHMYSGAALLAAEASLCGVNHARVGMQLARNWDLGADMCLAIYQHHDYAAGAGGKSSAPETSKRLVAAALIADGLAAKLTRLRNEEWEQGSEFALDALSLVEDDLEEVLAAAGRLSSRA